MFGFLGGSLPLDFVCFDSCPVGASCSGDFVTFADIAARGGYRRLSWNARYGGCIIVLLYYCLLYCCLLY